LDLRIHFKNRVKSEGFKSIWRFYDYLVYCHFYLEFLNYLKYKGMHKLSVTLLIILSISFTGKIDAQGEQDFKYRRSSLSMILIESDNFPSKQAVMKSWSSYPFPDKYNKHDIAFKSIDINNIKLSEKELLVINAKNEAKESALEAAKAVNSFSPVKGSGPSTILDMSILGEKQEYQLKIDRVIHEERIAKKLVARWFNNSSNGKFDMKLIQERGFYNASEMEASIAKGQTRGLASLGDAGEELLRNTFVTFTKFDFVENEPVARKVRDESKESLAKNMATSPKILRDKANKEVDELYDRTKEGYSLWSKTWLYRLNWNDSIATIFYKDLWPNPKAFDKSDLFSLEFVGVQYNQSLVTFKLGEKRTQEQSIDLVLVRNVDHAFAELQKDNDVFKPKVPVLTVNPITAQIGTKEGLSGGEHFDVLEMEFNPKTGTTEYKTIGSATADKKLIWDNRYNAGEKVEPVLDKDGSPITATPFKGSKNIQPGMLLIQKK